jgi:hypothetical protein
MGGFPISRFFRLNVDGVRCDERGLFVGGAPTLERSARPGGRESWKTRPAAALNRDLEASYGFPVDASAKQGGLTVVAEALERGDLALAQIAALLLRFPDPPSLTKDSSARGAEALAWQLIESGLLKADWDSAKHPRAGEPPNPGWFAPKDDGGVQVAENDAEPPPTMTDAPSKPMRAEPAVSEGAPPAPSREPPSPASPPQPEKEPEKPNSPGREIMRSLRDFLKQEALPTIEAGEIFRFWANEKIREAIANAVAHLREEVAYVRAGSAVPQILLEEALASGDAPRSLEELQPRSRRKGLGYDDHHLVQANPGNVAKDRDIFVRFGSEAINDPNNIVRIPRVKHRLITNYYNETDPEDPQGRRRRQVESEKDFNTQREDGLAVLRLFGVLE